MKCLHYTWSAFLGHLFVHEKGRVSTVQLQSCYWKCTVLLQPQQAPQPQYKKWGPKWSQDESGPVRTWPRHGSMPRPNLVAHFHLGSGAISIWCAVIVHPSDLTCSFQVQSWRYVECSISVGTCANVSCTCASSVEFLAAVHELSKTNAFWNAFVWCRYNILQLRNYFQSNMLQFIYTWLYMQHLYYICPSDCLVSEVLMRVSLMLSATGVALTRACFNLQTASASATQSWSCWMSSFPQVLGMKMLETT